MDCPNPELQQPENPNDEHGTLFVINHQASSVSLLGESSECRPRSNQAICPEESQLAEVPALETSEQPPAQKDVEGDKLVKVKTLTERRSKKVIPDFGMLSEKARAALPLIFRSVDSVLYMGPYHLKVPVSKLAGRRGLHLAPFVTKDKIRKFMAMEQSFLCSFLARDQGRSRAMINEPQSAKQVADMKKAKKSRCDWSRVLPLTLPARLQQAAPKLQQSKVAAMPSNMPEQVQEQDRGSSAHAVTVAVAAPEAQPVSEAQLGSEACKQNNPTESADTCPDAEDCPMHAGIPSEKQRRQNKSKERTEDRSRLATLSQGKHQRQNKSSERTENCYRHTALSPANQRRRELGRLAVTEKRRVEAESMAKAQKCMGPKMHQYGTRWQTPSRKVELPVVESKQQRASDTMTCSRKVNFGWLKSGPVFSADGSASWANRAGTATHRPTRRDAKGGGQPAAKRRNSKIPKRRQVHQEQHTACSRERKEHPEESECCAESSKQDYLAVVQIVCTCDAPDHGADESDSSGPPELIEFPVVFLNISTFKVDMIFHRFVRPTEHPQLSDFCMMRTGLEQHMVDEADTLDVVLEDFQNFLHLHSLSSFRMCSGSGCDMAVLLKSECKRKGFDFPNYWYELADVQRTFSLVFGRSRCATEQMLEYLGLQSQGGWQSAREGCRQSAFDEAKNTAIVAGELLRQGYYLAPSREPGSVPGRFRAQKTGRKEAGQQVGEQMRHQAWQAAQATAERLSMTVAGCIQSELTP